MGVMQAKLGLRLLLDPVQSQGNEMDKMGLRQAAHQKKSETAMCTSLQRPLLLHNIPDEAVGLNRPCPGLGQDGGAWCVYIIDDGCSNLVKVYGQHLPEVKLGQVEKPGSWYSCGDCLTHKTLQNIVSDKADWPVPTGLPDGIHRQTHSM